MKRNFYVAFFVLLVTNCMGRAQKGVDPCQNASVKTFPNGDPVVETALQDMTVDSTATCAQLVKNNIDTCEAWFTNSPKRDDVLISCADGSSKAYVCAGKCKENTFGSHDTCEGGRKRVAATGGQPATDNAVPATPGGEVNPGDEIGTPVAEVPDTTPDTGDDQGMDDSGDPEPEVPAPGQPVQIGDTVPTGMVVDEFPQEISCLADQESLAAVCLKSVDPTFTGDNIIVDCQRKKALSCEGRCMADPSDATVSICESGLKLRSAAVGTQNPADDADGDQPLDPGGSANGTYIPPAPVSPPAASPRSSGCD